MGAFKGGFGDAETQVRIAAVEAFAQFFRSIQRKAQAKYFSLIPEILNILPPIKDSGNADLLTQALVSLIELAEVAPKMFKPLFNSLVQFSISVIQDKDLGETARQNALELMATFADNAPQMCRKDPNFTNDMVTQCLSLMTDVGADDDDAEEWNVSEDVRTGAQCAPSGLLTVFSSMKRATRITSLASSAWIVLPTSLAAKPYCPRPSTGCRA